MERKKFGRLLVVARALNDKHARSRWHCICDCGVTMITLGSSLRNAHTKSCGCLQREIMIDRATHRKTKSPEYHAWDSMKRRCLNPQHPSFKNYGGRGIRVCKRWLNSFENFYKDMGQRPNPLMSLERKRNNSHYTPSNCKWATRKEQQNNRRNTKRREK
jgi:hypothetical protein